MRLVSAVLVAALLQCTSATVPKKEEAVAEPGVVTITGLVTNEGVECPAVRGDDGKLYTITGPARDKVRPGMRVRISGNVAEISTCMQGTTISASDVEELK
jgi:hypothetical protein